MSLTEFFAPGGDGEIEVRFTGREAASLLTAGGVTLRMLKTADGRKLSEQTKELKKAVDKLALASVLGDKKSAKMITGMMDGSVDQEDFVKMLLNKVKEEE